MSSAFNVLTDLGISGAFLIPKEDATQADIDPQRHVYLDYPERDLVGFPVLMEATHQMHCLNKLRMNLYFNIEHTRKGCMSDASCTEPEEYKQIHIGEHPKSSLSALRCLQMSNANSKRPLPRDPQDAHTVYS